MFRRYSRGGELFSEAGLGIEGGLRFASDGVRRLFEVVSYFEDGWGG